MNRDEMRDQVADAIQAVFPLDCRAERGRDCDACLRRADMVMAVVWPEIDRLHTWDGLLALLDEHWPEDIFPTEPDNANRDPGPRIVSLLRWVDRLAKERNQAEARLAALNAVIDAAPDGSYIPVGKLRAAREAAP